MALPNMGFKTKIGLQIERTVERKRREEEERRRGRGREEEEEKREKPSKPRYGTLDSCMELHGLLKLGIVFHTIA